MTDDDDQTRVTTLKAKLALLTAGTNALAAKAGDWDEDKHPRDEGGRFGSGGGGGGGGGGVQSTVYSALDDMADQGVNTNGSDRKLVANLISMNPDLEQHGAKTLKPHIEAWRKEREAQSASRASRNFDQLRALHAMNRSGRGKK